MADGKNSSWKRGEGRGGAERHVMVYIATPRIDSSKGSNLNGHKFRCLDVCYSYIHVLQCCMCLTQNRLGG